MEGRCGCPDHVLSAKAGARSQWPTSCMDLKYYAVTNGLRGMSTEQFDAEIKRSLVNCTRVSGLDIVRVQNKSDADIEMRPEAMSGGILAYAYLPNNTCGGRLAVRFNSSKNWNPNLFVDTHTHELGHTFGLSHTNDVRDIMYPSMGRDYHGKFSDHFSIPQLFSRYGADDPSDNPDNPDQPDDPNGDDDDGGIIVQIPWPQFFELLLILLQGCMEQNATDAEVEAQLKEPRPMQKWRYGRKCRKAMNMTPKQWRQHGDEIMQQVWTEHALMSNGDRAALISEARERLQAQS